MKSINSGKHSLKPLLKETYDNLHLFEETDPEKLAKGSYRFIIRNGADSHTAFHTEAGFSRWLADTGVKRSGCRLVGKYTKVSMAGNIEKFDAFAKTNHLRASIILDNGEYTRAYIKESKHGNTIYYLNPNYPRETFPYKHE